MRWSFDNHIFLGYFFIWFYGFKLCLAMLLLLDLRWTILIISLKILRCNLILNYFIFWFSYWSFDSTIFQFFAFLFVIFVCLIYPLYELFVLLNILRWKFCYFLADVLFQRNNKYALNNTLTKSIFTLGH